jgi:hypothetical protein
MPDRPAGHRDRGFLVPVVPARLFLPRTHVNSPSSPFFLADPPSRPCSLVGPCDGIPPTMTHDEYEKRKRRLDEDLRVGVELLEAAHRHQLRALQLVLVATGEEELMSLPPVMAVDCGESRRDGGEADPAGGEAHQVGCDAEPDGGDFKQECGDLLRDGGVACGGRRARFPVYSEPVGRRSRSPGW